MIFLIMFAQLWHSYGTPQTRLRGDKLTGIWQSCQGPDGYEERIFNEVVNGKFLWAFHMGPDDEFALYAGRGPDGEHDHNHGTNLLGPAYHYRAFKTKAGGRNWTIPSLRLSINVVAAGGSRDECESYAVKISTK